jgi:hypothetical protein
LPEKSYLNKNTRLSNFSRLRNHTRNTQFFTTHQKQQKRLPKEQPVNEFHFINCKITVFGRRRKTQQRQRQQQGEASIGKTLLTKFPSSSGFRIRNAKRARESRASASLSWATPAALFSSQKKERTNEQTNERTVNKMK